MFPRGGSYQLGHVLPTDEVNEDWEFPGRVSAEAEPCQSFTEAMGSTTEGRTGRHLVQTALPRSDAARA